MIAPRFLPTPRLFTTFSLLPVSQVRKCAGVTNQAHTPIRLLPFGKLYSSVPLRYGTRKNSCYPLNPPAETNHQERLVLSSHGQVQVS